MTQPPWMFPPSEKWSWMNFPNRLELLLYTVLAFPNASMMGLQRRKDFHFIPSTCKAKGKGNVFVLCATCSARWPAPPGCFSPTGKSRLSSGSSPTGTEATAWCSPSSPPPIPRWSGQTPEHSTIQLNTPWPSVTFPYLRTHSILGFDGSREIALAPGSISIRSRGKPRCNKA